MSIRNYMRALALLAILPTPVIGQQMVAQPQTPKTLTAEEWRADLNTLMAELRKRHKNMYHATPQAKFDSAVASLDARIPELERHEIIAEMMKIVAMVGDGHTNIYPSRDRVIAFHVLPISLYLFKDGWYVRAADSAHKELVGARVIGVGDASIEEAFARMKPYIGRDNEMGAKFWAAYLLTMPEMLNASRLSRSVDSARFDLEVKGVKRTVWLKPASLVPMTPADTDISWWASPGWVDARSSAGSTPLWLSKRPDSVFWWYQKLTGTRVGYANISQVRNGASESFEDFSNRLLAFVDTAGIDKLIIDVRLNRGGNGSLLKPLERGLLRNRKFNKRGNLFILTGRSTWSAAQFFLNDMLEFSEAMFVGEPSGSRGNSYGDSRQIVLPNSGITARASIYYWQDWHPLDERPWIAPDIAAELTFADYRANRDPALQAALEQKVVPSLANQLKPLFASGDTVKARNFFPSYLADPQHVYIDGHPILDEVALYFLNRSDYKRATPVFVLAAEQYPNATRAHLNLAAMYQQLKQPDLERKSLMRVLELEPSNQGAAARLRALTQTGS